MFEEQFTENIEAGAPDITYSGNEGPKSPQQEQQMQMAGGENDRVRELLYKQETQGLSEIEKIELRELIKTISAGMQSQDPRQMAAYGGPMDPGRGQPQDEQGKQVAAQIWEQMAPEQKQQFGSFDAFFASGIWKKIIQQMQADQSGITSQAPEMSMDENVNMQEQMPGGGIADVDINEQVQMRANGGLMGLYNRGR